MIMCVGFTEDPSLARHEQEKWDAILGIANGDNTGPDRDIRTANAYDPIGLEFSWASIGCFSYKPVVPLAVSD
jgi:hypothetical protein